MEPIFTIPYSEYAVAQQLRRWLPATEGYSLFVPLSRQEKGVDLIVTRRRGRITRAASIQVKASRTYSPHSVTDRSEAFRFYTWFNNFELPGEADFVALIGLYPPEDTRSSRRLGSWWAPVTLLFSHKEMKKFLRNVRTRGGERDRMFGFGFDNAKNVFLTRGDQHRRRRSYAEYLVENRARELRSFLGGKGAGRISAEAV